MASIYLAGPIDFRSSSTDDPWRELVKEKVRERKGAVLYDPYSAFECGPSPDPDFIVAVNDVALASADVLVAHLSGVVPSVGAPIEVERATRQGVPTILFVPEIEKSVYIRHISNRSGVTVVTDHEALGRKLTELLDGSDDSTITTAEETSDDN